MPPITPYDYQIVDRAPQLDERLTDLAVIGVPDIYQSKRPVPEAYPHTFDDSAREVWNLMLESPEYLLKISGQTLDGAWHQALQLFQSLCFDLGLNPFVHSTSLSKNDHATYLARRYRIQLKGYIDDTQLFTGERFEPLQVRTAYREYVRTPDGLIISSWADMFPYPNVQRTDFEAYLTDINGPRFLRYVDNHFVHVIVPDVQVWIKCINMLRIQVGFTIELRETSVEVPGNKLPTRKEVDAFIDSAVWLPLLRQHKFKGVTTRLF